MTATILPPVKRPEPSKGVQIAELAARYKNARGLWMRGFEFVGGQAEDLLDQLPEQARDQIEQIATKSLETSFLVAKASRSAGPDFGTWGNRALAMGTGIAGGMGGITTALFELPVTTTLLLRSIQEIAEEYGFDVDAADTRADCLEIFAAAGPGSGDDGADLGFFSARVTITGASLQTLLKQVAPRFAAVLGQKLAAQTVPVLGAAAGASINYSFTRYFQEIAHVQFGIRKLAEESGFDRAQLLRDLQDAIQTK